MKIRQGDILLVECEANLPDNITATTEVILAIGEVTGHNHRLTAPAIYDWSVGDQRYVRVIGGQGILSHEEHDPIPVPVLSPDTTWEVIPQREYSLKDSWARVRD